MLPELLPTNRPPPMVWLPLDCLKVPSPLLPTISSPPTVKTPDDMLTVPLLLGVAPGLLPRIRSLVIEVVPLE